MAGSARASEPVRRTWRGWFFRWLVSKGFTRHKLRGTAIHRFFGENLFHADLWKPRRGPVARGWLLGCVVTPLPIWGFRTVGSAALAIWLRANLPVVLGLRVLFNLWVAPLYAVPCYFVGRAVFDVFGEPLPLLDTGMLLEVERLLTEMPEQAVAAVLGGMVLFTVIGVCGYTAILLAYPTPTEAR